MPRGTGMIRSTFTAVPKRAPVVWGKALVLLGVLTPVMIATAALTVLAAKAVNNATDTYGLDDGTTLRIVLGGGLAVALFAVLGTALGWLIRSSPGALVAFFVLTTVAPPILASINKTCERIADYSPTAVLVVITHDARDRAGRFDHPLSPTTALAVLAAWVVVTLVLSQLRVQRSDVAPG